MRTLGIQLFTALAVLFSMTSSFAEDGTPKPVSESSFQQLAVAIGEHGNIFLEGASISSKQLKSFINRLHNAEDYEITVLAHDEADSQLVLQVMDICCNYKVGKVKLVYTPNWDHKG